jgi:hypothetical protein
MFIALFCSGLESIAKHEIGQCIGNRTYKLYW